MEEIKVGEYVRSLVNGEISKVLEVSNLLEELNIKWYEHAFDNGTEILSKEEKQDIDVILNLIEKQSKEIEELKFRKEESIHITKETVDFINSHYIHKDKIKAKIEEIEKRRLQDGECELALHGFQREAKLEVLQSLLNEEE